MPIPGSAAASDSACSGSDTNRIRPGAFRGRCDGAGGNRGSPGGAGTGGAVPGGASPAAGAELSRGRRAPLAPTRGDGFSGIRDFERLLGGKGQKIDGSESARWGYDRVVSAKTWISLKQQQTCSTGSFSASLLSYSQIHRYSSYGDLFEKTPGWVGEAKDLHTPCVECVKNLESFSRRTPLVCSCD